MTSGVYTDRAILLELKKGCIVINPFNEKQLNPCSYNVTLSEHFYRENKARDGNVVNPWNKESVSRKWNLGKVVEAKGQRYAPKEGKYIELAPKECILAATNEFIGSKNHITTLLLGRSSMSRCGINICSGWGDVGFVNRWSMLITNLGRSHVILPVGCEIAQIVFQETGEPNQSYNGKYQQTEEWKPSAMLPLLHTELPEEDVVEKSKDVEKTIDDLIEGAIEVLNEIIEEKKPLNASMRDVQCTIEDACSDEE